MNIKDIARNIREGERGIFYSKSQANLSYPEEGNEACMQIEEESFWFRHRNNVIAKSVKNFSPEGTFYDVGGGNGYVSKRLQDDGMKVLLVEPGQVGSLNAYKRGVDNVLCSSLEHAGFVDGKMDAVGLFDVVEHIENDFLFLELVNKYLKAAGYIYITVPAYNFLWSNEDKDAGHFRRYTLKDLNQVLKETGFSIEYSTYIFSILPFPIFFFRSLPSRLGLHKNSNELAKHQNEHKVNLGWISILLDKIWNWELSRISKKKKIAFGGTCFVVAKKIEKK